MNKEYKIRVYWDLSGETNAHTLNEVSKRKYDKICKEKKIPLSEDIISVNVENHSDMSHDEIESYVSESLYKTYGYISSFWFEA